MKSWKEYITEVKHVFDKKGLIAALRAKRGMNSDNPDQDSDKTEKEDSLEYQKKELEYVNKELAKQTSKSNKKVKSLKKKIGKLKDKVSDLEDENEELSTSAEAAEDEKAAAEEEETKGNEEEGEAKEEGGEEESKPEENKPEEQELGYDPDLDSVMDLGGKKKKNESWEILVDQPIGVLMEAVNNGVAFYGGSTYGNIPCWFASLPGPTPRGLVILKGTRELNVVGNKFNNKEIGLCVDCLTKNLPDGVKWITASKTITPGVLDILKKFENKGWAKTQVKDATWDERFDKVKFEQWLRESAHDDMWESKKDGLLGDFLSDTYPKVPVLERPALEN